MFTGPANELRSVATDALADGRLDNTWTALEAVRGIEHGDNRDTLTVRAAYYERTGDTARAASVTRRAVRRGHALSVAAFLRGVWNH